MNNVLKFAVAAAVGFSVTLAVVPDAHAATTIRSRALATAKTQYGAHYRWGATGGYSKGYDCSGLVYYSYRKNGKTLQRTAQAQYNKSSHVSASKRKTGDLVFIGNSSRDIYHVGIYAGFSGGYGWMVDAPRTGSTVGKHKIKNYTAGRPKAYYGRY